MCITAQVFNVLDLRIQFGRPVKVSRRRRPFALAIVSVGARVHICRFLRIDLEGFCVFRNCAVPVAHPRILSAQQKVRVRVLWIALDRVFEFEHGIGMIVLRAGDERQTKVCFRRPGIHVRGLGQIARCFSIPIEVV